MPELPEVETTRRGISPHTIGRTVLAIQVRQTQLRWPITPRLPVVLGNQVLLDITRRGKYLLLHFANGTLIAHLGMSGCLRVLPLNIPAQKHDHVDILFDHGLMLRLTDPRRFGALLWTERPVAEHKLICRLGPEPLSDQFNGTVLYQRSRGRRQAIKAFIMDSHTVVGIGNIYANEALFLAGIRPDRACGTLSKRQYERLVHAIQTILRRAIDLGGTTLKDFVGADGRPGYFAIELAMYGHAGEPCQRCGTTIHELRLGNRSTYYCPTCQR